MLRSLFTLLVVTLAGFAVYAEDKRVFELRVYTVNPGKQDAANKLIAGGCKLISQHADSMGAPTACETAGSRGIEPADETSMWRNVRAVC